MADRKHGHPPASEESETSGLPPATRDASPAAVPVDSEIRNEDWQDHDFAGGIWERVGSTAVDFTEAVNQGGQFADCTFRDCTFNASEHTDAAFVNCTFVNCSFFDASFTGCKLVGAMFDRCTFGLFKVTAGDWSFVGLPGADLSKSAISGVRMREADLTGTRLTSASVRQTDLSGAWLAKADLTKADLRGSDLSTLDPLTVQLKDAIIDFEQAVVIAGALGLQVRPG